MDKKELRQKWVEALRSGKYKQGTLTLHEIRDKEETYCVWGVGCEVYNQHSDDPLEVEEIRSAKGDVVTFEYNGYLGGPPRKVMNAFGLSDDDTSALILLNDSQKMDFEQLAKLIEDATIESDQGVSAVAWKDSPQPD